VDIHIWKSVKTEEKGGVFWVGIQKIIWVSSCFIFLGGYNGGRAEKVFNWRKVMTRLSRHLLCECGERIYEATGYTLYDKDNNVVACLCEKCGEDEKVLEKYGVLVGE
jgi:hypothetical protein